MREAAASERERVIELLARACERPDGEAREVLALVASDDAEARDVDALVHAIAVARAKIRAQRRKKSSTTAPTTTAAATTATGADENPTVRCPSCARALAARRFAWHLERCLRANSVDA